LLNHLAPLTGKGINVLIVQQNNLSGTLLTAESSDSGYQFFRTAEQT
jgi:hypothetical protein